MDKDMIAVRIGPDIPMAIVGAPEYLSRKGIPVSVAHLVDHQAINLYLPSSGTANRWRLVRGGREVRVRMEGQLLLNTIDLILDAAIDGHGLAYLPYDQVRQAIEEKTDPRSGEIYARLTGVSSVLPTPPSCGFGIFSVN